MRFNRVLIALLLAFCSIIFNGCATKAPGEMHIHRANVRHNNARVKFHRPLVGARVPRDRDTSLTSTPVAPRVPQDRDSPRK